MATVRVVYYGLLQRRTGIRDEAVMLADGAVTVSDVVAEVARRHPAVSGVLPDVVCAVGDAVVTGDRAVTDGDEVGLLPPVSGG